MPYLFSNSFADLADRAAPILDCLPVDPFYRQAIETFWRAEPCTAEREAAAVAIDNADSGRLADMLGRM